MWRQFAVSLTDSILSCFVSVMFLSVMDLSFGSPRTILQAEFGEFQQKPSSIKCDQLSGEN